MSAWSVPTFAATSPASGFPMALFKSVNSPIAVTFPLHLGTGRGAPRCGSPPRSASPAAGRRSRSAASPHRPAPRPRRPDLNSRIVTRGTWRGLNQTYTFAIPASALHTGTNSLTISVISGSSGTGFLSPNFVFDALALDPA